jgi:hypothetical protein
VRGTTRTLDKGDDVKAALEKKHGSGKVEIAVVEDMDIDGAFDETVKGQLPRTQLHLFHALADGTKVFLVSSM